MNKEKIELIIEGFGGNELCIDALRKEDIMEIYNNTDWNEVSRKLARLSWENHDMWNATAMYRVNIKTGETFFDVMARGNFDEYEDLYPVMASLRIEAGITDETSSYLASYENEIYDRVMTQEDFNPDELDRVEDYEGFEDIVDEILEENNTSRSQLIYNEYEDYVVNMGCRTGRFVEHIDRIYDGIDEE